MILDSQNKIEGLCSKLEDTLVIVCADHGHKDIDIRYNILDYPEILECLIMPPYFEQRALTFWVKEDKKGDFVDLFNKHFCEKFLLLSKKEFLDNHFLGYGIQHKKIDDFIGDYVALSISDASIKIETNLAPGKKDKRSTHCGLTKDEMEVPLIVIE